MGSQCHHTLCQQHSSERWRCRAPIDRNWGLTKHIQALIDVSFRQIDGAYIPIQAPFIPKSAWHLSSYASAVFAYAVRRGSCWPFTKNDGVPRSPRLRASRRSWLTVARCRPESRHGFCISFVHSLFFPYEKSVGSKNTRNQVVDVLRERNLTLCKMINGAIQTRQIVIACRCWLPL